MTNELMHVVDGKAITNYHKDCLFVCNTSGKILLCKLHHVTEFAGDIVAVQFFEPELYPRWSDPVLVKCDQLHWYKIPNFTGEDLIK